MSSSSVASLAGSKVPAAEELVARAQALAPRLRERAVQAERDRNMPKELVQEYIDAGLMRTITPRRWAATSMTTRWRSTSRSSWDAPPADPRRGASIT